MTTALRRLGAWRYRRNIARNHYDGCTERWCQGKTHQHEKCHGCGDVTCSRGMAVEPKTLRRRLAPLCFECRFYSRSSKQSELKAARTKRDFEQITTPVVKSAIVPEQMGEQFPGKARTAVRAFVASGAERATVPGLTPAALDDTIAALGLGREIYAEQRGKTTVLRRVLS